ncbi:MAG TPA: glycosyltransferase family 2 protein [Candidatus Methylomirabilis sp.]|nr:glycosyltransferase family 2 protein [Candidatus Methylomirabilis sp.]
MPERLSAVIITRNAAAQLVECLESVRFADEILIVDSGSQDATLDIARRHNARVVRQDWLGYGKQKQFAVAQAANDWVLCLDADERVSAPLAHRIQEALRKPNCFAYDMPRCNRFMGRWLRHGEGYPDPNLRLFHRQHARWSDDPIHEHVVTTEKVGRLDGDLLHETETTLAEYLEKQNRYTTLQAERLHAAGKRVGAARLVLSPFARFIKFYFLRRGFLDGVPGLVHIIMGCFNSFMKYAKLMQLSRTNRI